MLTFIVDDNPDDRLIVLHQLRGELTGAQAVEIGTAEELETAFAHHRPSLVITDLALGWATGIDVLLRTKATYPQCPVIMFTGAGDEQAAVEAMKSGLDDYVVKDPRRLFRLRRAIREFADLRSYEDLPAPSDKETAPADLPATEEVIRRVREQVEFIARACAQGSDFPSHARSQRLGSARSRLLMALRELDAAASQLCASGLNEITGKFE